MRPTILPLTSFRFIAALAVVIFHYNRKLLLFPVGIADFGYEAVTFFFILSGFVLTYAHGRNDGLNVSKRTFSISRLSRIAPAYMLALIVCIPFIIKNITPAYALVPAMLQSWWPPAALYWNAPAWSLSNEVFFYALYPAIWAVWRKLTVTISITAAAALIIAVTAINAILPADTVSWHNFSAYFPLLNIPQFILGIALAKTFIEKGSPPATTACFVLFVVMLGGVIAYKSVFPWLANGAVLCLTFGAMIYCLAGLKGIVNRALSAVWLVALGEASYAIYILHVPIWLWWDHVTRVSLRLEISPAIDFAAYLGWVIAISLGAMIYVERPSRHFFQPRRIAIV